MLTPEQVKNRKFEQTNKGGYATASVDNFMAEISESYEQMFKENGNLYRKVLRCAKTIQDYQDNETNIQKLLIDAQRASKQIIDEANEKAAQIISEAEDTAKASSIISNAETQAEEIIANATAKSLEAAKAALKEREEAERSLEEMKQQVETFRQAVFSLYEKQIETLTPVSEKGNKTDSTEI